MVFVATTGFIEQVKSMVQLLKLKVKLQTREGHVCLTDTKTFRITSTRELSCDFTFNVTTSICPIVGWVSVYCF